MVTKTEVRAMNVAGTVQNRSRCRRIRRMAQVAGMASEDDPWAATNRTFP